MFEKKVSRRDLLRRGLAAGLLVAGNRNRSSARLSRDMPADPHPGSGVLQSVDIHAHYFPEAYLNLFNEGGKRFGAESHITPQGFYYKVPATVGVTSLGRPSAPLPTKFIDLKQRVSDMDQQGVNVQALSLTSPMVYWGDAEFDHKLATAWNDAASAAHQSYPTRFVGLLTLPMLYPDRAIEELNRAAKLPGMRGVYLGTNIDGPAPRRGTCRWPRASISSVSATTRLFIRSPSWSISSRKSVQNASWSAATMAMPWDTSARFIFSNSSNSTASSARRF